MRPNLITRLKEEWKNLDPVDPLRGLIADAIDALAEQPAPVAKPHNQQEPVAWVCYGWSSDEKHAIDYEQHEIDAIPVGTLLYTSPPASKPWVGLTDEEIGYIADEYSNLQAAFRAIESKLKERNA